MSLFAIFIKKGSITASMVDAAKDVEAEAEAVAAERAKEIDANLAAAAADTQADSNIETVVQSARETSNDGSSLGKLNNAATALDRALFDVGQRVEVNRDPRRTQRSSNLYSSPSACKQHTPDFLPPYPPSRLPYIHKGPITHPDSKPNLRLATAATPSFTPAK